MQESKRDEDRPRYTDGPPRGGRTDLEEVGRFGDPGYGDRGDTGNGDRGPSGYGDRGPSGYGDRGASGYRDGPTRTISAARMAALDPHDAGRSAPADQAAVPPLRGVGDAPGVPREPAPGSDAPGIKSPRADDDIILEGFLKMKAEGGIKNLRPWYKRYFVLHRSSRELRYYKSMVPSLFGNIPIDECGSVPLEFVVSMRAPEEKEKGRRLELEWVRIGKGRYPRPAEKARQKWRQATSMMYLRAETIAIRQDWQRELTPLIGGTARLGRFMGGAGGEFKDDRDGSDARDGGPLRPQEFGRAPYDEPPSGRPVAGDDHRPPYDGPPRGEDGYDRRPRDDGYGHDPPRGDGYDSRPRGEDGYDRRPRDDGYGHDPPRGDGYHSRPRDDGYGRDPPRGDGYGRDPPRSDGYGRDPPRGDGYGRDPPRDDGYSRDPPRDDGYGREPPRDDGYGREPPRDDGHGREPPRDDGHGHGEPRGPRDDSFDRRDDRDGDYGRPSPGRGGYDDHRGRDRGYDDRRDGDDLTGDAGGYRV